MWYCSTYGRSTPFFQNRHGNDNLEQQAQALFKAWFVDFEPFRDGEFVNSVLGSTPKELPITYIENIPHNIESGKRPKGGATLIGVPSIGACLLYTSPSPRD